MELIAPKPGYRSLRRGRWSGQGYIYLVTTVANKREKLFNNWECASIVAGSISQQSNWIGAKLLCWVLMPDHWHGLVQLEEQATLGKVMQLAKGRSARALNLALGRLGPVWMPGFHDRALRRDEDILVAARYLVANPLRARLVEHLGDYPYWDCVWIEQRRG